MLRNYEDYEKAPLIEKLRFWEEEDWRKPIALDENTTITKYDMLDDLAQLCLEVREALESFGRLIIEYQEKLKASYEP